MSEFEDFGKEDDSADEDKGGLYGKQKPKKRAAHPMDDEELAAEEEDQDDEFDQQNEDEIFDDMRERQMDIDQQNNTEAEPTDEVAMMEHKLIENKPWQMKGEVRGLDRPKNALVDEQVDVEFGVTPKIKVTKEMNNNLEEVIKQRILDEQFDDPKEYIRPALFRENYNLMEDIQLEKDKRGLGELYEEDYKKNILGMSVETKEGKMKLEIEDLFKKINHYLDN